MTTEHSNVIQFPNRKLETIAGVALDLGRMSLDELVLLERQCSERHEDAQLEMLIVQEALAQRTHGGPGGGAA